jgi:hypothetical protein
LIEDGREKKIIERLIKRVLKLIETPSPQRGWFMAVPYKSEIDPNQCGIEVLSNLEDKTDLQTVWEGITLQCLAAGIHPKFLADGLVNCVDIVERAKERERKSIVVPGKF